MQFSHGNDSIVTHRGGEEVFVRHSFPEGDGPTVTHRGGEERGGRAR